MQTFKTAFKTVCTAAVLLLAGGVAHAEAIDRALERRIDAAVSPAAKKMKLVRDLGTNATNDAVVSYANEADCDGAQYCTVMAVFYDASRNCQKRMGKPGFMKGTHKMRDIYNLKHKNVCYQISVHGRRNAEAVAAALKAKM